MLVEGQTRQRSLLSNLRPGYLLPDQVSSPSYEHRNLLSCKMCFMIYTFPQYTNVRRSLMTSVQPWCQVSDPSCAQRLISCSGVFGPWPLLNAASPPSLFDRIGPFLDICDNLLLQAWGNTTVTLKQCFPQSPRCLILEHQPTLLLAYEDHEALPRLTETPPSMRVAVSAIKQAQRPGLSTTSNGAVSVRRNAERRQRRNYR